MPCAISPDMGLVTRFEVASILGLKVENEPDYALIYREGDKELRQYRGFVLAKTKASGPYVSAIKRCYSRLTEYLGGENFGKIKLPFRTPIFQQKESSEWSVAILLPDHLDLRSAPAPVNSNVSIQKIPPKKVAVIRYSMWNSPEKIKEKEIELRSWLSQQRDFASISPGRVAEYGPPLNLPLRRRHEVHIDVKII